MLRSIHQNTRQLQVRYDSRTIDIRTHVDKHTIRHHRVHPPFHQVSDFDIPEITTFGTRRPQAQADLPFFQVDVYHACTLDIVADFENVANILDLISGELRNVQQCRSCAASACCISNVDEGSEVAHVYHFS